jgi:hypothetical protein
MFRSPGPLSTTGAACAKGEPQLVPILELDLTDHGNCSLLNADGASIGSTHPARSMPKPRPKPVATASASKKPLREDVKAGVDVPASSKASAQLDPHLLQRLELDLTDCRNQTGQVVATARFEIQDLSGPA